MGCAGENGTPEIGHRRARQRFRPILMTSITTILGLFPASLATGIGSDVQRPLATVIVYGLMFSTLISMFLLPAFYYLVENNVLNKRRTMKKNIRYNIVLLLLMVEAVLIPAFAQMPEIKLGQSISFEEYLNRVAKKNLSYLAEKLNVSIADAEVIAGKSFRIRSWNLKRVMRLSRWEFPIH